jgi:hypothetical protein
MPRETHRLRRESSETITNGGGFGHIHGKKPNVEPHYPQIEKSANAARPYTAIYRRRLNPSRNRPQEHGGHKKKSQKEQVRCTNTRPHQIRGGRSHEFGRDLEPPRWPANSVSAHFLSLSLFPSPRRNWRTKEGAAGETVRAGNVTSPT